MSALNGRHQGAWTTTEVVSSSPATFRGLARAVSPSGGGAMASPASRPVPSLFPRAAFPQEDEGTARAKSPTTAVAADNLLSLILSAAPPRSSERFESPRGEWTARTSADGSGNGFVASLREEEEEDASGDSSDDQPSAVVRRESSKKRPSGAVTRPSAGEKSDKPTPKRRYKKPTYIVRREKKEVLEEELRELSTKLVRLRRESGIPDWFFQQKEQLADKSLENVRLRDAMHQQDMYLANASRLMLVEYMSIHSESPIKTFIHLTPDLKLRRSTLMGLKDFKLQQADTFVTESARLMPKVKHWCQESKYEADNGDFCAIKMDNTPFCGVKSVRQVFDALQFFFRNMEISISEMLGDITVREDDDSPDNSLSNHRLVSVMSHGVKVEKNIVKFFKYIEAEDGSSPYALVATDAVDIDEMYPYIPEERMRMDINAAMKFTEHFVRKPKRSRSSAASVSASHHDSRRRSADGKSGDDGDEEEYEYERVVVLTRFFRAKLHHTEIEIPPHVLQEIRQGLACFTDTMVKTMHRIIYETPKRGIV